MTEDPTITTIGEAGESGEAGEPGLNGLKGQPGEDATQEACSGQTVCTTAVFG